MYIRMGDYYVSIWLFVIVIAVIAIVSFAIFLILRKREDSPANDKYFRITQWQKKNIVEVIEDDIAAYGEEDDSEEYVQIARSLQGYVKRHREWNAGEIVDIHPRALALLTSIILDRVCDLLDEASIFVDKESKNYNFAILLLVAVDFMNGGPVFEGSNMIWLGNDLPALENHQDMSIFEARLLNIYLNEAVKVYEYIDEDIEKIPADISFDERIKRWTLGDIDEVVENIETCIDVKDLGEEERYLIIKMLEKKITSLSDDIEDQGLKYHQLYYIRALACILDSSTYDYLISTIDFS